MNNTKIDWATMSWNPVSGCYHNCEYCYARGITNRFGGSCLAENCSIHPDCKIDIDSCIKCNKYQRNNPIHKLEHAQYVYYPKKRIDPYPYGFEPTFHEYRLDEPKNKKKSQNIFVCSMADLFGNWVPNEWIIKILEVAQQCKQHNFMFLTKNPKRYKEFEEYYQENMWFGTTITGEKDKWKLDELFKISGHYTFLSIEPLMSELDLSNEYWIDWIILGAMTGKKVIQLEKSWIKHINNIGWQNNIPIFMKENIKKYWDEEFKQQYPERLKK